ncbi:MAG: hypothetical protein ABL959_09540 [Pyrinomonadaceae bacterium]
MSDEIVVAVEERTVILEVGIQGPQGPSGVIPAIYLAHGDATPAILDRLTADRIVKSVTVIVTEAFNGSGATLTIGINGFQDLLVDNEDVNLAVVSTYDTQPGELIISGTDIKAWITPGGGSSTGRATILIEYANA